MLTTETSNYQMVDESNHEAKDIDNASNPKQTQNKLLHHFESSEWNEICEIMANEIEVIKTPAAQIMTDIYHQSMQDWPTFIKNTSLSSPQTHDINKLSKSFKTYQSKFSSSIYAPLREYLCTTPTKFEGNANDLLLRISEVVNIVKKQAVMKNCGIQFDLRYPTKIASDRSNVHLINNHQDGTKKEINSYNDEMVSSAPNSVGTDLLRKTKISMIDITKHESFGEIIESKLNEECKNMSEFDYSRYEVLMDNTNIVKVFFAIHNNTIPAVDIANIPLCRIYNSTNSVQSILDYLSTTKHQDISHMMTFSIHIYHGHIEIYFHLYANGKLYGSRMFEDDLSQIIPKLFEDETVKETISIHDNFVMDNLGHHIQFNHPTKYQQYNLMLHKQHTLKEQKKRIYKSKTDSKKQQEQKEKLGQMVLKNLIDRQVKEERKLHNKSATNGRMTRHKSLYLAQTRYKCAHCDIIIQDIANLSCHQDEDNLHCHKCYASPYDKKHNNLSLQWLSVNTRSAKCQFNHTGPCLSVYIGQQKQRQTPLRTLPVADKKIPLIKLRRFGTLEDVSPCGPLSNLRDINFLQSSWKKPLQSRQNTADNDIILGDKSFWDDILSSDSSDSEDGSILCKDLYKRRKPNLNNKTIRRKFKLPQLRGAKPLLQCKKASRQLIFPLTDRQLKMATNEHHLKMLMDDMIHFGSIGVDTFRGFLKLNIPADLPTITPVHKLEKRLGVLLTIDEVNRIRHSIRGEDKVNKEQGINMNEIDVLKLNDADFVNNMMNVCEKGMKFIKHKKRGVYDERYVVIHNDRLFWKEKQDERNHRSRSMHLTKIIQVMTGKMTKALKHETLDDIPSQCCFSVVAKKATLDLSAPTMNSIEVRIFTAYLKGLQRHFISQQTQFMSQAPQSRQHHLIRNGGPSSLHNHHKKQNVIMKAQQRQLPDSNNGESGKMKLSPIGTGFGGFRFGDDMVQQTQFMSEGQQTKHRGYHKKEAVKDQPGKPQRSSAIQREGFIDNTMCPECGIDADQLSKAKQQISEQKQENQQLLNTVQRKKEIIKQRDSVIMEQKSEIEYLRQQIKELQININHSPSPPVDAEPLF